MTGSSADRAASCAASARTCSIQVDAAIVPAAGRGRRLGGAKAMRPFPDDDGVERPLAGVTVRRLVRFASIVVVVVPREDDALRSALAEIDASVCVIDAPVGDEREPPMLVSIQAALSAVPPGTRDVLMTPADVPVFTDATVERVVTTGRDGWNGSSDSRATMPEVAGRGGHPVWMNDAMIDRVRALDAGHDGGLRAFWLEHVAATRRIPVDDAWCVVDLDTPERYAATRAARAAGSKG